ncbi:WhiB family transcriptional regulator [Micromonospora krabiensis]|uniref:Transcription factor WhiB n=1 Tax=Micromonospora krabiensis TaxID=307121 RepID=A0A1C3N5R5_9ACTN|nr:WhiB family transcriptional regulator [Micromonospora krabiensis]SBV27886.1 Transcription factor WhiB [Micromonospora krabiensis]
MISATGTQCNPANAEIFFAAQKVDEAVDLCLDCPVMFPCRDLARAEGHVYGVWGGETPDERRAWLVENHPDPEVRAEAARETARIERERERSIIRKREHRAYLRIVAAQAGVALNKPVDAESDGPTIQQVRSRQLATIARQMRAAGADMDEIAEELGATRRTIQRYMSAKYDNIAA